MATVYEIPLSGAHQSFSITLGSVDYRLRLIYRDMPGAGWVLDILDTSGVAILSGVPLVTGVDLLSPYRHLGIGGGGSLWCFTDGDADAVPTFENLGGLSHLAWMPDA